MKIGKRSFFKILGSVIGLGVTAPVIARAEQAKQPEKHSWEPEKRSWRHLWLKGEPTSYELDIPGNKVTVQGFDRSGTGHLYGKEIV